MSPLTRMLPMLRELSKGRSVHVCAGAQSHGLSTQHLEPSLSVAVANRHGPACILAHRYQQPSLAVALNRLPGELSRDHSLYVCAGSRSQPRGLLITPSHTYCDTLKHDAHEYSKDSYARNDRNNDWALAHQPQAWSTDSWTDSQCSPSICRLCGI